MAVFSLKVHLSRRKSATKFIRVQSVSGKVVRYLLAYLSQQKWLVGDIPFYESLVETDPPSKTPIFNLVFARSASSVTP